MIVKVQHLERNNIEEEHFQHDMLTESKMQHFRTLDPVADRDYSVVYFCTRYMKYC